MPCDAGRLTARKDPVARGPGVAAGLILALLAGCLETPPSGGPSSPSTNITDPTNGNALYLGSPTCDACHAEIGAIHDRHGHSHILNLTFGRAPTFTPALPGTLEPPPGLAWSDFDFVVGGHAKGAQFIDRNGFLVTDQDGALIQYHLAHPPSGNPAGFSAFTDTGRTPYIFDCIRCHTTAPQSLAEIGRREDNRPGIDGEWVEEGVQCEACHGPGSNHVGNPSAGTIFVASNSTTVCNHCHSSGTGRLLARGAFIAGYQQADEMAASPHTALDCTTCHDPHVSVFADRDKAIRNQCRDCHTINMALHEGKTYTRGDLVEPVTCESCHMPYASMYFRSAAADFTNGGMVGDTRSHVMYINTEEVGFSSMFTADGSEVVRNTEGKAAVTVDYVCLRCHHGKGSAFELDLRGASAISAAIHSTR